MKAGKLLFRQLFDSESSTYTYLLADSETGAAILIDPVLEKVERDWALLQELGLKLHYVLETHVHADHITGASELRRRSGAKVGVSKDAGVPCADLQLHDGQKLPLDGLTLEVLATPGHTDGCVTYLCEGRLFTGDALTIRGAGRTDFQQGSPERLFASIREKLFRLPRETRVYPGHDYRGLTVSTIGEEMDHNPRIGLAKSREEFVAIMNSLNLPKPKRIDAAVPANLACGNSLSG